MFENQTQESCEAARDQLNRIIATIEQTKTEDLAAGQPWYGLGLEHAVGIIKMHADIAWLNLATPESGDLWPQPCPVCVTPLVDAGHAAAHMPVHGRQAGVVR